MKKKLNEFMDNVEESYNPICPFDLQECNVHQELTLSGTMNCHNCDRGNNNVRATGGMPCLEAFYKWVKSLIKK